MTPYRVHHIVYKEKIFGLESWEQPFPMDAMTKLMYPAGHIITGDLGIVTNEQLRELLTKGPKYRIPQPNNWKKNFKLLMDAVEDYATQSCQTYKDVDGAGCTCDNTNCSINILNEFSLHHLETTTTTSTTTQSITQSTTPTTAATTPTTKTPTTTPSTTTTTKSPTTTTATTTTTPTTTPTTTIPTTTTPTTTTVTTTTAPTTTPTTAVPTATTPTTTTPTATTTATGPRTCHICGDTSLPVPCSSRQIGRDLSHTCNTGENYCMTDIVQDDQGNVDVFKRCVDLATCEKKWITESADLDYCKRYGVVKNPYAFSCHFCCTEDKCNSMLVPNTTTWYTKTN
ncbi:salivary glue protein Sgs-3-like [Mytilus trossulus]|uniref:salivary glue protein Sgs-3-like n=1 Tax=Mytilus trossulus TaxID=6551 RepID=UPI003004B4A4